MKKIDKKVAGASSSGTRINPTQNQPELEAPATSFSPQPEQDAPATSFSPQPEQDAPGSIEANL